MCYLQNAYQRGKFVLCNFSTKKLNKKLGLLTYPEGLWRHPPDGEEAASLCPVVLALVHVLRHPEIAHLHHVRGAHHAVPRRQISAFIRINQNKIRMFLYRDDVTRFLTLVFSLSSNSFYWLYLRYLCGRFRIILFTPKQISNYSFYSQTDFELFFFTPKQISSFRIILFTPKQNFNQNLPRYSTNFNRFDFRLRVVIYTAYFKPMKACRSSKSN